MGFAAQPPDRQPKLPAQLVRVLAAPVLQFAAQKLLPHAFISVEFGGVGGQPFQVQAVRRAGREEVLDGSAVMNRRAVPDDEQLPPTWRTS